MKESERQWYCMNRAAALINITDADTSSTIDGLEPKVLRKLKAKGMNSLRGDLVTEGEVELADTIIFKKAYRLLDGT